MAIATIKIRGKTMSMNRLSRYAVAGLLVSAAPFAMAGTISPPSASIPLDNAPFDTTSGGSPAPLALNKFDQAGTLTEAKLTFNGTADLGISIVSLLGDGEFETGSSVTLSVNLLLTGPRATNPISRTLNLMHEFVFGDQSCALGGGLSCTNGVFTLNEIVTDQLMETVTNSAIRDLFDASKTGAGVVMFDVTATIDAVSSNNPATSPQFIVGNPSYKAGSTLSVVYTFDDQTQSRPVPAPGILAMTGMGLLAFGAVRRRMG